MDSKQVLRDRLAELQAEHAAIKARSAPQREELDALRNQEIDIRARVRAKREEIAEIEGPRAITLPKEIAAIARSLGPSMKAETGRGVNKDELADAIVAAASKRGAKVS